MSTLVLSSTLLAISVVALLWAETKSSRLGIWLTKPIASTLFFVTALLAGALDSSFGQLILLGLMLSWFGDVFLIPKGRLFFVAGLVSFLFAHLTFSVAFLLQPLESIPLILAAAIMTVFAIVVLRWLWPHLPDKMRPAVVCYLAAISVMVVLAVGAVSSIGPLLAFGAVIFAVSDIFVARNQFVTSSVANRLWGLPLYYAAQLIFALSVHSPQ